MNISFTMINNQLVVLGFGDLLLLTNNKENQLKNQVPLQPRIYIFSPNLTHKYIMSLRSDGIKLG